MPARVDNPDDQPMSFGDHLEELRKRLLWGLAAPFPLAIIIFFVSDTLIQWLLLPLYRAQASHDLPLQVQVLTPPEYILARLKISVIVALVISLPWLLWQTWLFIRPGLYVWERRFVYFLLPGSAILTTIGLLLMYFIMLPLMMYVLVNFGVSAHSVTFEERRDPRVVEILNQINEVNVHLNQPQTPNAGDVWLLWPEMRLYAAVSAEEKASAQANSAVDVVRIRPPARSNVSQTFRVSTTINFILLLLLGITIAFHMPLVIVVGGWLGIITPEWLAKQRKYALVVCGAASALLTPQDVVSMVVMLIPLYGLYELSIILLRIATPSAVAGEAGSRYGSSDKDRDSSDQPHKPVQSEHSVPRSDRPAQPDRDTDDEQEDES